MDICAPVAAHRHRSKDYKKKCMVISIVDKNTACFTLSKYSRCSRMYMYYFYNQEKNPLCLKTEKLGRGLKARCAYLLSLTCSDFPGAHARWSGSAHTENQGVFQTSVDIKQHPQASHSIASPLRTLLPRCTLISTRLTDKRSPVRFDLNIQLTGKKRTLL